MQVHGADKGWTQLAREGTVVARCTVQRLMRRLGMRGVMRGKVVRTTVSDSNAPCPLDRVNRQFRAERPNQLWVSDFTYVSTWHGWLYVASSLTCLLAASENQGVRAAGQARMGVLV
jgi:putative transposase